jgi:DNA replication and repair protein RecF
LVLVVGRNGAGKTNLLESLHVGTQGFSPRTRSDGQIVRFGVEAARVSVRGTRAARQLETEVTLMAHEGKRALLNGARLRAAEQLRTELQTLVFTPDRLTVVKGAPAVRRAYFDRALGRLAPARVALPAEYGAAVGQRNAALRRVAGGFSPKETLAPCTERVAVLGSALTDARRDAVGTLGGPFETFAGGLGLEGARLAYDAEAPTVADLEARLWRDLDRGTTSLGPHRDDIAILAGARDLRSFGSQGEQRIAVLSLLLAEAALIEDRRSAPPLLLLDDVLSELDEGRRRALLEQLPAAGQTIVTATAVAALPAGVTPALVAEVSPGTVKVA